MFRIVGIFAFVAVFWMLFDQKKSTWIQQADRMDRHFNLRWFEFTFLSKQLLFVNPGLVMVLIPAMSLRVYPWLERRGLLVNTLPKMTVGMAIASLAYVAVALIQNAIDVQGDGQVHLAWQLVPYAILTLGEVMVSVTGLEFAYSQAPKRMKSVVMGFWALASSIGNKLVVLLAGLRGSVKMEIERTPRNFRRSHLAPRGAYSRDDDGLIALLGARASECWEIAGERQSEF